MAVFPNRLRTGLLALAFLALVPSVASAHASVLPKAVATESYEKFTLRIPNEKNVPTVRVRVELPEGFQISRVKPMPGWAYRTEKAPNGTLRAIEWRDGTIEAGEFQEFEFQGKTAKDPGKYAFRVLQTYGDGETVQWTGPSGSQTPAAFVEVRPGVGTADEHGATQSAPVQAGAGTPAAAGGEGSGRAGAAASPPVPAQSPPAGTPGGAATAAAAYGGVVLAAVALILALRRR